MHRRTFHSLPNRFSVWVPPDSKKQRLWSEDRRKCSQDEKQLRIHHPLSYHCRAVWCVCYWWQREASIQNILTCCMKVYQPIFRAGKDDILDETCKSGDSTVFVPRGQWLFFTMAKNVRAFRAFHIIAAFYMIAAFHKLFSLLSFHFSSPFLAIDFRLLD